MEENNVLVEEVKDQVSEHSEEIKDAGHKVVEAAKNGNVLSIILLVVLGIGLVATGGWVVFLGIFLYKKIKAKLDAKKAENDSIKEKAEEELKDDVIAGVTTESLDVGAGRINCWPLYFLEDMYYE